MSEIQRRASNAEKALALLQERGAAGATNAELLAAAGFRYGGRVHELRKAWHIETRQEGGGLFRFVLHGPVKAGQQALFQELA
jgi:hypothetical protein